MKNTKFKIKNFNETKNDILKAYINVYYDEVKETYKINNYLGKGTTGQVYLISLLIDSNIRYVIKISNKDCKEDLLEEITAIKSYFNDDNILSKSAPKYYGYFINLNASGIIYPFLGYYNLDKIKEINYTIDYKNNISIIKQIIEQMIEYNNIIHCDLKACNVVVNLVNATFYASIVDFGLIRNCNDCNKKNVISTCYISSPESLLTLKEFSDCLVNKELYLNKHDYFGLASIILNLFVYKGFWKTLSKYLMNYSYLNQDLFMEDNAYILFVYCWYKFNYKSIDEIKDDNIKNVIIKIEKSHTDMIGKHYLLFDDFFDIYVIPNINYKTINTSQLSKIKEILKKLIKIESSERPDLKEVLKMLD